MEFSRLSLKDATPATLALHADDILNDVTDVAPPIHMSTTFRYNDNPEDLIPAAEFPSERINPTLKVYSRLSSPNLSRFETILSSLLNGYALAYSSGLSALHAALVLFNPCHISIGRNYHGCHGVIGVMSRLTGLKKLDIDCPADQLQPGDLVLLETPLNPHGTASNIYEYANKAHSKGAFLIVDSTFAPPGLQDPFQLGADLVMHSGSKYFGGHSDMLCGVLATQRKEWFDQLWGERTYLGNVMGNLESWLGVRSLRTLEIRIQRQSQSAERLVSWFDTALKVENPASNSNEAVIQGVVHELCHASLQKGDMPWLRKQMPNGYGPVFSLTLKTEEMARALPSKLAFFHHATSLGGVETLIEWRAMSDDNVDRRLLRISVGLESWEDLKNDLMAALRATFQP